MAQILLKKVVSLLDEIGTLDILAFESFSSALADKAFKIDVNIDLPLAVFIFQDNLIVFVVHQLLLQEKRFSKEDELAH